MTLNALIKVIETFAASHLQVKTSKYAMEWEWDNTDANKNGFALWYYVGQPSINQTMQTVPINFSILSQLLSDKSNVADVQSDAIQIAGDLMAWMDRNEVNYNYSVLRSSSLNPFEEKAETEWGGVQFTVTYEMGYAYNECQVPDTVVPTPDFSCARFKANLTADQVTCLTITMINGNTFAPNADVGILVSTI